MKILHVVDALGLGGAERHLVQAARYLSKQGVRQRVAQIYAYSDVFNKDLSEAGVSVATLGTRHGIAALPGALDALIGECRAWKPDVLSSQLPFSDMIARAAAKRLGLPVVCTWQNTTYDRSTWIGVGWRANAGTSLLQGLERLTAGWAKRYIAVSSAVQESYCRAIGVEPSLCDVIPNTVDLSRFPEAPAPKAARAGLRLIHVSRHVAHKGVMTLVEALALMPEGLAVSVDLFGEGPETERLKSAARRLGCDGRLSFRGLKPDLAEEMLSADAFVLPSYREGLSLAYLEALAAGLPAIVSDIAPNREIDPRGEATLFFKAGDARALAGRIEGLARDENSRASLGARAPALVKPYAIEAVGPKLLKVLTCLTR